jgi:hypothetical protein
MSQSVNVISNRKQQIMKQAADFLVSALRNFRLLKVSLHYFLLCIHRIKEVFR